MKTQVAFFRFVVFGAVLVSVVGVAGATVITNSSFEDDGTFPAYGATNSITGWTSGGIMHNGSYSTGVCVGNGGDSLQQAVADNGLTPDGTHVAWIQIGTDYYTTTLSATVSELAVGQQYQLTYYESARYGYPLSDASVTMAGSTIVASHAVSPVEAAGSWITPYNRITSSVFTAATTSETLVFINQKPSTDTTTSACWLIDNVQIAAVGTPEPGTMALVITGMVGLLAYAWRKRR